MNARGDGGGIGRRVARLAAALLVLSTSPMDAARARQPGFGPGPFNPGMQPPAAAGPAALPALAQAVVVDVRKLVNMVPLELDPSPASQQLVARVNTLMGAADNFNRAVNGRTPPPQLLQLLAELQGAHQGVSAELANPALAVEAPGSVRMNQRVGARIAQVRSAMPAMPGPRPQPGVPPEVLLHQALKRELTGLIGEVDLFVAGLNPKVPEGPQLQAEAIGLQNSLRTLRRDFNRPRPEPVLIHDFNQAVAAHRALAARVERLNKGRVGPNVQRVRNIGATLARIQQAAPGL